MSGHTAFLIAVMIVSALFGFGSGIIPGVAICGKFVFFWFLGTLVLFATIERCSVNRIRHDISNK